MAASAAPSARRDELLEGAYAYVLEQGLSTLSLRPLATAIGSSPRVLLFLFGSKSGLVRALLARARADELEALARIRRETAGSPPADVARAVWSWLADERHRGLLRLWVEGYARSLVEPEGEWAGFARSTVEDWLALLADHERGRPERTLLLAVLRGALLDLLATGDVERTTRAVELHLTTSAAAR
jgi:AcrR family transcriptional regulator